MAEARYIIGIDLGTTNTAVAYVDTKSAEQRVQIFDVPQLVAPAEIAGRRQLPSFLYLAGEHDLSPAETALPWDDRRRLVVGELARAQGAHVASRMIASSKSWLCHSGVDRSAAILPWGADDEDVAKMSPVTASAMILRHIQEAWNEHHEDQDDGAFEDQEVMVTVPASFDEAARELTLAAADTAGYEDVVLPEEPQAAFYAWIENNPASKRKSLLAAGSTILIFDIGGGTTDFTLIKVGDDGESFERTAVGDHLLLGGDNIDLTLAIQVEKRLSDGGGKKLGTMQWQGLVHTCRLAKERLLCSADLDEVPVSVAGSGSKLIGGSRKDRISRDELMMILHDGFFPEVEGDVVPTRARSGLQQFGLPYAADPAITKHLASFLARHGVQTVDAVLFNGGAMTPVPLQERVLAQIGRWQKGDPKELSNELPELAVAKGAAYYGLVRRGLGSRIRGGTPRSFYVGVESAKKGDEGNREAMAVCLAGMGLEEGSTVHLDRDFELVCNRPVSFKLYSSSTRHDAPGDIAPVGDGLADATSDDSDLLELPPIVTVLRARGRSKVTVQLEVKITELGSLEIWCCEPGDEGDRWRLSFDMRAGGASKEDDTELGAQVPIAQALLRASFRGESETKPAHLIKALEKVLDARRDEWNMGTARALFDATLQVEECRKKSADHEARWLNLCGFCLRPGRGAPLDEWRIKQMWRVFNEGLAHEKQEACRLAWWILWRRIAGGMEKGQQEQLYDRLAQLFLPSNKQKKKWHQIKPTKQEAAEMWRTLANLERITPSKKMKLGDELIRRLEAKKNRNEPLYFWALGRIGERVPLYGPLNSVVPPQRANTWLTAVLAYDWPNPDKAAFPMAQLGRRTGDRARDIDETIRGKLSSRLKSTPGGDRTARLVEEIVELEAREERVALGDSLPAGLRLVVDDG